MRKDDVSESRFGTLNCVERSSRAVRTNRGLDASEERLPDADGATRTEIGPDWAEGSTPARPAGCGADSPRDLHAGVRTASVSGDQPGGELCDHSARHDARFDAGRARAAAHDHDSADSNSVSADVLDSTDRDPDGTDDVDAVHVHPRRAADPEPLDSQPNPVGGSDRHHSRPDKYPDGSGDDGANDDGSNDDVIDDLDDDVDDYAVVA